MDIREDQTAKIYLIAYFWLFLAVQTVLVYFGTELESPRGIINTVFTYMAFIPFYGYIYNQQFPTRFLWRTFVVLFFLWETAAFSFLYPLPLKIRLMQILMMSPLFWSVAGYALVTVQSKDTKKAAMIQRREKIKVKFKSFIVIAGAMALLMLMLCLFVMVHNYWQTRNMI